MQISNYGSKPNFNTNSQKPKLAFGKSFVSKDGSFKFDDRALTDNGLEVIRSQSRDQRVKFPSHSNLDDAQVEKAIRRFQRDLAKSKKGSDFNVTVSLRNILNEGASNSNEMVTGQVTITPKSRTIPEGQLQTKTVLVVGSPIAKITPSSIYPKRHSSVLLPPENNKKINFLYRIVPHIIEPSPEWQKSKDFYALVPDKGEVKHPREFKLYEQIVKAYKSLVSGKQPVKSKRLSASSIGESVKKGQKELTGRSVMFDLVLKAVENGVRKKPVK